MERFFSGRLLSSQGFLAKSLLILSDINTSQAQQRAWSKNIVKKQQQQQNIYNKKAQLIVGKKHVFQIFGTYATKFYNLNVKTDFNKL